MVNMKNSGIEWIGKVPKNWNCKMLKYILAFPLMYGANESGEEYNEQYPRYIRITDIDDNNKLKEDGKLSLSPIIAKPYILQDNDILFARSGASVGKTFLYKTIYGKAAFAGYLIKAHIDTSIAIPKYIYYSTLSTGYENWKNSIFTQATIQNIGADKYSAYKVPIPSINEQREIVSFLDERCAEIDALSGDIQAEIDILEEYKRSIITEKVTKGLNPDVIMKDSCIEWVGLIPATWGIHPLYYYFGERKAKNYNLKEQNLLSLSYGKIIRKDINANGGLLPANFCSYNIVENGDIIVRPTDLQNDKRSLRTGLVTEHGIITSAYIDLMPKSGVNSKYFHYLLHAYDIMKVFYNMGNGVRQGLNYSEFSKLLVVEPSEEEQQEIVDYLDDKCAEIDFIIEAKKEQLMVLDKYKKTIIYEYVTGKKEVP